MRKLMQALVIVPLLFFALALPMVAQDNSCTQLQAWLHSNQASLPSTYDQLLAYPLAYRPTVFDALSPKIKAQILVAHFQKYVDEHPGISSGQISVIQEAIELASRPDFFTTRPTDALWDSAVQQPIQDFEGKALFQFTREEFKAIFTRLGDDTTTKWPGERRVPAAKAASAPICTCSTQSDWCSSGTHCAVSNCSLTTGCGTFLQYTCNGFCYFN
ncbi:MAG TPA: bacteriocin fulvocin C-related protein [Thermoanaerobaculia bacterium]|jgi:hypothetical protein|nr:bacteriocin fulvocin C-related protein [Thermoanaerobaculia bacterium]